MIGSTPIIAIGYFQYSTEFVKLAIRSRSKANFESYVIYCVDKVEEGRDFESEMLKAVKGISGRDTMLGFNFTGAQLRNCGAPISHTDLSKTYRIIAS